MKKTNNGFTLIELIMVMIILGVLAAVAIPRYMDTIENAEEAAEDAIITNVEAALEALKVLPQTYSDDGEWPNTDNEWTFVDGDPAYVSHQRSDNSRWKWEYDAGINTGTDGDTTGYLNGREALTNE